MSRKNVTCILWCLWMMAVCVYGQQEEDLLDENAMSSYDKAIVLNNEDKNYLEAYRQIVMVEQSLDAALAKRGGVPALNNDEFKYPYWPIKKTKAEIAYTLGIYSDMKAISQELHQAYEEKYRGKENEELDEGTRATLHGMLADLAKIDGSRHFLTEKYDSAEMALTSALRLGSFPGNTSFICKVHDDLAQLYYKQGVYDKALAHLDSILASPLYQEENARSKETKENIKIIHSQRALCLARLGKYAEALKEMEPVVQHFKKIGDKRLYAEALRKKAKILMLEYDVTGRYNPVAKACYEEYLRISKDFIDRHFVQMSESEREQYWMAEQPFVTDCFRLEDKAPELLYDVALYSKAVLLQMGRDFKDGMTEVERKKALLSIRVNWRQVRDRLPASGCAVEFIVYDKGKETHIGALVLTKKSSKPQFIDIADVATLSNHSVAGVKTVKEVLANTTDRDRINDLYNDSAFHRMVWTDELVSAVGECNDVYFSPDGLFYQIGIEYITPPSFVNKRLFRLTTTRLLVTPKHKMNTDKMLICGAVEYGLSAEDKESGNDELAYTLLSAMDLKVDPLPNSALEIDSICTVRKTHREDKVLRADSVTEAALTQLMKKYHIVHISTHGLFSEVATIGTDIHPAETDMQLSRSCLFLSGSEKNLHQGVFDASQHDGLLSARELAKMDLSNVDLTVMSACMSGLGYITPDGVYGLQRGLKSAGVNTIISTLWSVDDEASCYFIVQLYKNLEAGQPLHDAFWNARTAVRKYEKSYGTNSPGEASGSYMQKRRFTIPKYNKPYFYNAFILIDGL